MNSSDEYGLNILLEGLFSARLELGHSDQVAASPGSTFSPKREASFECLKVACRFSRIADKGDRWTARVGPPEAGSHLTHLEALMKAQDGSTTRVP